MKKILLGLAMVAMLAACSSTPKMEPKAAVEDRNPSMPEVKPPPSITTVIPDNKVGVQPDELTNPSSILSKRSIFYDLDKYDVKDEYKPLLQAHARYLSTHASAKILIQGNCDERGSREYNLALGQKRSDGVKKMMQLMGAQDAQLESVSLGEEKPRCSEANEACYSQNRRSDIVYNTDR